MLRLVLVLALSASTLFATACNGAPAPTHADGDDDETTGGEDEDELVLGDWDLPARPHGLEWDEPPLDEGAMIAHESLAIARPLLPTETTAAEMHVWVDGALHDWLLERARAIRAARTALEPAEDGDDAQHIVAAAILGVMYADLAWEIAEIVLPTEVRDDELGALAMRNALLGMSAPLFDQALSAFGACAQSAVGSADPTVERWARFCDDESERVVDAPRPIDAGHEPAFDDDVRDDDEEE